MFFSSRRPLAGLALAVGLLSHPVAFAAPPQAAVIPAASAAITVHDAWARASAGAADTGAAYVSLLGGNQADALVSVSVGVDIATTAQVHESIADNGVVKMRPVASVPIPPGQMVTFAPNGYHIMLMGLKRPLMAGSSFPITLHFAHAQPMTVTVQIRSLRGGSAGNPHMQM